MGKLISEEEEEKFVDGEKGRDKVERKGRMKNVLAKKMLTIGKEQEQKRDGSVFSCCWFIETLNREVEV